MNINFTLTSEVLNDDKSFERIKELIALCAQSQDAPHVKSAAPSSAQARGPWEEKYRGVFKKKLVINDSMIERFPGFLREDIAEALVLETIKSSEPDEIEYIDGVPHKDGKVFDILSA